LISFFCKDRVKKGITTESIFVSWRFLTKSRKNKIKLRLKTADDIMPGNDLLTDNGDGTWTVEVTLANSADLLGLVDVQHLLFTGSGYTPLKLYFK
jgi:hypothetical protein